MHRVGENVFPAKTLGNDFAAGLVVFLVALPLCLGIALACQAPLVSGLLAGIVGGIVVGFMSGSHTSVSGPAAGLTAVIALEINALGSFEAFLGAVFIAGVLQIMMGLLRIGFLAEFFPTSVIKGLLAAIGVILVLKQLPHLVGLDTDFEGDMAFLQPDQHNTLSELLYMMSNFHFGAMAIGISCLLLLVLWDRTQWLKKSPIPSALVVVVLGTVVSTYFAQFFLIGAEHRVQTPVFNSMGDLYNLVTWPDFSALNMRMCLAGFTLALVASLETLLNVQAIDKIDPYQRTSPPNRELVAQGLGNMVLGLIGGLPVTSVVVRSSVNVNAGGKTKKAAIIHGLFLLVSVLLLPNILNLIPLSALAAILIVAGFKLASPSTIKSLWSQGPNQFVPFLVTVIAILFSDLLIGVVIGLITSIFFILKNSMKSHTRLLVENHLGHQVRRVILPNQVSFLNKASLARMLETLPQNDTIVIDATDTNYIDADVLDTIKDFERDKAPRRSIKLSLVGFKPSYELDDSINYIDYATLELQQNATPNQVLRMLKEGNRRVRQGHRVRRDFSRQIEATAQGQYPLAVILSCIDSRAPVELIFDLGIGDVFSVRMAGHVVSEKVLGSIEFACAVAGAKLIVVMGHTKCGAVSAALNAFTSGDNKNIANLPHLKALLNDIKGVAPRVPVMEQEAMLDAMIRENIQESIHTIVKNSPTLAQMIRENKINIVGCLYDIALGSTEFINEKDHQDVMPEIHSGLVNNRLVE